MYADDELEAAIAEGVLTAETVGRFRAFVAARQAAPLADEEQFRLLTGFNDIFVAIALGLTLVPAGILAGQASVLLSGPVVVAPSWALAEHFTRRRRMALPGILLLLAFAGSVGGTAFSLLGGASEKGGAWAAGCLAAGLAATGHWWRFRVPITIAALAVSLLGAVVLGLRLAFPVLAERFAWLALGCGLLIFAMALNRDATDRLRRTRRSDVAFWLHLAVAPLLVHPIFAMLGVVGEAGSGVARAVPAIALYVAPALVALVIDRRALLVSALAYVIYAASTPMQSAASPGLALALTGLLIGAALLLLSAWWRELRARVLPLLPGTVTRLVPPAG